MLLSINLYVVLEAQYGVHIKDACTLNLGKGIEDLYPSLMSFLSSPRENIPKKVLL